MDQDKFAQAQKSYDAGDFRAAAKQFLASAGRGSEGNGAAYHMAGNALMKLRRYSDAVTVYAHALRDGAYDHIGAVYANVGRAYSSMGDYSESVKAYEAAIAQPDYGTPYKAWQGIARALMDKGDSVSEAASAYRTAALDPTNPDPGKALVNLGLCFMAMGRPSDAVEAYKAALGFDSYENRGKALANLGQAYVATGEFEDAVRSFEKAVQLHSHTLSSAASDAFAKAKRATAPAHEVVEGWVTGELVPVGDVPVADGWNDDELYALLAPSGGEIHPVGDVVDDAHVEADEAAPALGFGDEAAVNDFFRRTDEDMRKSDKEAQRVRRSQDKASRSLVSRILAPAVAVIILVAVVVAGWSFGLGWPTQEATVDGLMKAYQHGDAVESYWAAVPTNDVAREMAKIPPIEGFAMGRVERDRSVSRVRVNITPQKGAELAYVVTLSREGVGWKATGIENDWGSTGE